MWVRFHQQINEFEREVREKGGWGGGGARAPPPPKKIKFVE